MRVKVIIQTHFLNFKWADKRLGFGRSGRREEGGKIIPSHGARRKYSSGISNILPFSGGRLFAEDTGKFTAGSAHWYESGIHVKKALWWHFHLWRRRWTDSWGERFPDLQHPPSRLLPPSLFLNYTWTGIQGDNGSRGRWIQPTLTSRNWSWKRNIWICLSRHLVAGCSECDYLHPLTSAQRARLSKKSVTLWSEDLLSSSWSSNLLKPYLEVSFLSTVKKKVNKRWKWPWYN